MQNLNRIFIACLLCLVFYTTVLAQSTGTVSRTANLRSGPGTTLDIVGKAVAGQAVTIAGTNPEGDWYQLNSGQWIAAFLVTKNATAQPAQPQTLQAAPQTTQQQNSSVVAQVAKVVDGDTIEVLLNGQTFVVRYILMDTPERGMPYYSEATEANRRLVEGQTVYLMKDVSETDRYGRLLRYVFLPNSTFVNLELVRQGYAKIATFPPDVRWEGDIRAAQQEAVYAARGLWAEQAVPQPAPPTPTPLPPPTQQTNSCDPSYPGVCIPPRSQVGDLDCGDIIYRRFQVIPPDPHRFDGDHDGIGCER